MKGAAALSDGNYRKNSDFSQYSSRLFLETESRRPVSHKVLAPQRSACLGATLSHACIHVRTLLRSCTVPDFLVSRNRSSTDPNTGTLSRTHRTVLFLLPSTTSVPLGTAFPETPRTQMLFLTIALWHLNNCIRFVLKKSINTFFTYYVYVNIYMHDICIVIIR